MMKRFANLAAVAALSLVVVACAADETGRLSGPGDRLADGSVVRATVHESLVAEGAGQQDGADGRRDVSAVVNSGVALLDAGGLLAWGRAAADGERPYRAVDASGTAHSISVSVRNGAPFTVRHDVGDGTSIEVDWFWHARGQGHVLGERVVRLVRHGRVLAVHRRAVEQASLASARPAAGPSPTGLAALLLPTRLEAQSLRCADRFAMYVVASGALAVAATALATAPSYATFAAFAAALAMWEKTLDNWLACEFQAE